MTDIAAHGLLRPLGAFERIIDSYVHRNPVQFSLAIELARTVTALEVETALAQLQRVHPLTAAWIDREADRPVFRASPNVIPLRTVSSSSWQQGVALEQTVPIQQAMGPLMRATLVLDDSEHGGTVLLVTFSHQIADGRGALRAAHDLLAILGGHDVPRRDVPQTQEDLLARPQPGPEASGSATTAEPTMPPPPPATLRPFDAEVPSVDVSRLDQEATSRLRHAARARSCTVQGVLCASAAQTLFASGRKDVVRINVPIDLRGVAGLDDEVVIRFTATTVVLQGSVHTDFWDLARSATAQLATARDPRAVRAAVLMLAEFEPADAHGAEQAMLAATNADIEITNLGVSSPSLGVDAARAVWGPVMTTQVAGEQILGVVTHAGQLRMTLTTHKTEEGLLAGITDRLAGVAV